MTSHLYFGQLQALCDVRPLRQRQVLLTVELLLQFQELFGGEGGASAAALAAPLPAPGAVLAPARTLTLILLHVHIPVPRVIGRRTVRYV